MKKTMLLIAAFLVAAIASAQLATPGASIPPLPPGPLLNRTPEYCRWTVVTEGQTANAPKPQKSTAAPKSTPPPKKVTYTKSGSIIVEESPSGQVWHLSNFQVTFYPGRPVPLISPESGGDDLYTVDFSRADFAGLNWISPETYKGIASLQGRQCLVFQGKVTPWTPLEMYQLESQASDAAIRANFEASKGGGRPTELNFHFDRSTVMEPAIVYIDLQSRLPIMLLFGKDNSQTRTYFYESIAPVPLTLPPAVAQAVAQEQQRESDLSRPPAPP